MKVLRPTEGILVIRVGLGIVQWVLGPMVLLPLWIFLADGELPPDKLKGALLASGISAVCLAVFTELADFTFDATRRILTWQRRSAFGTQKGEVPFSDIRDVAVHSRDSSGESYQVHRVELILRSGPLPVTTSFQTGRRSANVAKAIQEFLAQYGHSLPQPDTTPKKSVVGLEEGPDGKWWGRLDCGHEVHVRHDPPWADLSTAESRERILGMTAPCKECDRA